MDNKIDEFLVSSEGKKVIAFDFWDTIAHRMCNNHEPIVEWAWNMEYFLKGKIKSEYLYKEREKASKFQPVCSDELTYDELMGRIFDNLGLDGERSAFIKTSKQIEIEVEKKYIFLDMSTWEIIQLAFRLSKRVIIISDFYLGKAELSELIFFLTGEEIPVEDIFVSSDIGCRKDTGRLYNHVLEVNNLVADDMLMIGDSYESDKIIPESIGIKAILTGYRKEIHTRDRRNELAKYLWNSIMNGGRLDGYSPLLLLLTERLFSKAKKEGVGNLLFFSREGQILKRAFDIYQNNYVSINRISTFYVYISRRATIVPSLKEFSREDFASVFSGKKIYTIVQFLEFIGFTKDDIKIILSQTGLSEDDRVGREGIYEKIRYKLKNSEYFINRYDNIRNMQKEMFLEYIGSFGIDYESDGMNIVDIGWRGSIQDNIRKIVDSGINIRGFYAGLFDKEKSIPKGRYDYNNKKIGLAFASFPRISGDYIICRKEHMFWEQLFSADHGPVIGYKQLEKKVVPIIDNDESYLKVFRELKTHLSGLMVMYQNNLNVIWNNFTKISSFERFILFLYNYQLDIVKPKEGNYYRYIDSITTDNFISKNGINWTGKNKFLESIKIKIRYYMNYNEKWKWLFYRSRNKALKNIGNVVLCVFFVIKCLLFIEIPYLSKELMETYGRQKYKNRI